VSGFLVGGSIRGAVVLAVLLPFLATGCRARTGAIVPVNPALDARIERELERRIAAEPLLDVEAIRPRVEHARVHLHGSVEGMAAWGCVIRNASITEGVVGVVDFLVIERGPREGVCLAPRDPFGDGVAQP
jgi:hypothetical protein